MSKLCMLRFDCRCLGAHHELGSCAHAALWEIAEGIWRESPSAAARPDGCHERLHGRSGPVADP